MYNQLIITPEMPRHHDHPMHRQWCWLMSWADIEDGYEQVMIGQLTEFTEAELDWLLTELIRDINVIDANDQFSEWQQHLMLAIESVCEIIDFNTTEYVPATDTAH